MTNVGPDVTWISGLTSGDLLKTRRDIMFQGTSRNVNVMRNTALLLLEIEPADERVTFRLLYDGHAFTSTMLKTSFSQAFADSAHMDNAEDA